MAEKRGGYRRPSEPASYSGVGKRSRRTDGQAVKAPNVQEGTDLTQGDRRIIEQGQRIAPLSRTPAPQVQAPAPGAPAGAGGGSAQLPPHLFGGDSTRPDEPITEGLPFGPGAGPDTLAQMPEPDDDKEFVLHMLSGPPFNNEAAANMLREIQQSRQAVAEPMDMGFVEGEEEVEDEEGMEEEAAALTAVELPMEEEDLATEEEVAVEGEEAPIEPSVETPEAAPPLEEGGEPSPSTTSPLA